MKTLKHVFNVLHLLIIIWIFLILGSNTFGAEDITVAVADFTNSTGKFRFDTLEKSVPEMLKTELSRIGSIVVVERNKLESVLAEQALSQTGIIGIEDAQKVGQLVGAQYVISGEISQVQSRLRLDAHIVQSHTGKVVGEKVSGPNEQVIDKMIGVLANNIVHNLSGDGSHTTSIKINNYYPHWVLLSAAVAGAVSLSIHSTYDDNWQKYKSATEFNDFDNYYDKANTNYKTRNIMFGVTGTLLSAGIALWLHNASDGNKILAEADHNNDKMYWALSPYLGPVDGGFGVQLCCQW